MGMRRQTYGKETSEGEHKHGKDVQESERQYQDLYEEAPIAYISLGIDGNIQRANQRASELLGYPIEKLTRRSVFSLCADTPNGKTKANKVFLKALTGKEIREEELEVLRADGKKLAISLSIRPIMDGSGQVTACRSAVIDITERKQAEKAIINLDRVKSEFLSNISHELRTPLQPIRGLTKLILDGKVPDPETQREFLTTIESESQHLSVLVDNLLDMSRLESSRFTIQKRRLPIRDIILGTVETFRSLANMKNIIIIEDIPAKLPEIEADGERLRQVITNLLSNATKFSEPGSNITVKAVAETAGLLVQVVDNGIGIPKKAMPHLFERFYRVGDTAWIGGTGSGLYISRQIIEAHGGRIWAESKKGKGSTFSFYLPLNEPAE